MNLLTGSRVSGLVVVLFLLVMSPEMASAQGGRDRAAGAGEVTVGASTVSFGFAASSGSAGENPRGHVAINDDHFTVECLFVNGMSAEIRASGPTGPVRVLVVDGGDPGAGVDKFSFGGFHPPQDFCGPLDPGEINFFALDSGNIQVRDAP